MKDSETSRPVRLIILNPGHFHATLVLKTSYSQVAPEVHVFAPEGPEAMDHVQRVEGFKSAGAGPHLLEAGGLQGTRLPGTHVETPPGQRGGGGGKQPAKDPVHPRERSIGAQRPLGQTHVHQSRGLESSGEGILYSRREGASDLRHHDRAFRDHDDPAKGAGPVSARHRRAGRRRRPGSGNRQGQRPPSLQGGRRTDPDSPGVVLRRRPARRGDRGRVHPPGGPGVLAGVPRRSRRPFPDPGAGGSPLAHGPDPGAVRADHGQGRLPPPSCGRTWTGTGACPISAMARSCSGWTACTPGSPWPGTSRRRPEAATHTFR